MAAGLSPDWSDPDAAVTHALFFAIFPDKGAALRIERAFKRVRAENGLRGRPIRPDRYHISLHGLGVATLEMIALARGLGDAVDFRPFVLGFDHVVSWSPESEHPHLVLRGNDSTLGGLRMLHGVLSRALVAAVPGFKVRAFDPHLTLMYADKAIGEQNIEPIDWTVREFALIESLQGRTHYNWLGRWRLD